MTRAMSTCMWKGERMIWAKGIFKQLRSARTVVGAESRESDRLSIVREEGTALVEMALSSAILLATMIGIFEFCFAFYTYNAVCQAAREASRYASVRGATSCTDDVSTDPNCNILPNTSGNPIQAYVRSIGLPDVNSATVTATWLVPSQDSNGYTSWTTTCTGSTDSNGNPCNAVGNAVNVVVTAPVAISVPFWKSLNLTVSSTSQMVIAE
jgi:Flp pilus assembly protein TadG